MKDYAKGFRTDGMRRFTRDSSVVAAITCLGTLIYRLGPEDEKRHLARARKGIGLHWFYPCEEWAVQNGLIAHSTPHPKRFTPAKREIYVLAVPFWNVAMKGLIPVKAGSIERHDYLDLSPRLNRLLSRAIRQVSEGKPFDKIRPLLDTARTMARNGSDEDQYVVAIACTALCNENGREKVDQLLKWSLPDCSAEMLDRWAFLFIDAYRDRKEFKRLSQLAILRANQFSPLYRLAQLAFEYLAPRHIALVTRLLDTIERRMFLPELRTKSEPVRMIDVARHSSMLVKRWLWWAGNEQRAKHLIEVLLECPLPKRESSFRNLIRCARLMGDQDLVIRIRRKRKQVFSRPGEI